jgi:hypothetical protein
MVIFVKGRERESLVNAFVVGVKSDQECCSLLSAQVTCW